jgi:hypothetical protein
MEERRKKISEHKPIHRTNSKQSEISDDRLSSMYSIGQEWQREGLGVTLWLA